MKVNGYLVATACVAFLAAQASALEIPNVVLTVTATNATGTGSTDIVIGDDLDPSADGFLGLIGAPVSLETVGGDQVATINSANIVMSPGNGEGLISLAFVVTAGDTDTDFVLSTGALGFNPALAVAAGQASAGFTVTDTNGDGAALGQSGGAYASFTNGATEFARLVPSVTAGPNSSNSDSEEFPMGGGFSTLTPPDVDDMSIEAAFNLTAGDLGSGTSRFLIIPEPSAIALLAVGGLLLRRR